MLPLSPQADIEVRPIRVDSTESGRKHMSKELKSWIDEVILPALLMEATSD